MRPPEVDEIIDRDDAETADLFRQAKELHWVVDLCLCELLEMPLVDRLYSPRLSSRALYRAVVRRVNEVVSESGGHGGAELVEED